MLDANSKKILKFLNSIHNDVGTFTNEETIFDICQLDKMTANLSLQYLQNLNLIETGMHWTKGPNVYYRSTLNGTLYFKNKYYEMFLTIFKSVICPLLVSLITTLITLFLIK